MQPDSAPKSTQQSLLFQTYILISIKNISTTNALAQEDDLQAYSSYENAGVEALRKGVLMHQPGKQAASILSDKWLLPG